ncbi:MAG: tetratricopeptide repeat protein, partial [Planctomycetes bacterium]|nr:tetratricopeptide repeat protein [Planctomycetota bacterium]
MNSAPEAVPPGRARLVDLLLAAALFVALFFVYRPALDAGFVWDDDGHLTQPALRGTDGLARIWTDPTAAQQYYPLVHTLFWLEHRAFGAEPAGYHWINLALHACAALLCVGVLRRLALPGAWLAGALWALHPLQVQSVAWISEQKNTLSACFYFAAWLAWARFDEGLLRGTRRYGAWAAFVLFALAAVLSKTVTCTLVPAILLVTWAREGGRGWTKRVPWVVLPFLLAASFAVVTPWLEREVGRVGGAEHPTDLADFLPRLAVAGKDLWFYLGHLAWPPGTCFVHPRWSTTGPLGPSLLPAVAFASCTLALFTLRKRIGRSPVVALLYFAGTLFPALGFVDAIPVRYSFVADHFQYLAGLGPIVLVAAGGAVLVRRVAPGAAAALRFLALLVLFVLAFLARGHAKDFQDAETLWKATLEKNPGAWMAWNNLVDELNRQGRFAEAVETGLVARRLHPDRPTLAHNLGVALQSQGRLAEALACYEFAAKQAPEYGRIEFDRASALIELGRPAEALEALARTIELTPGFAAAHMLRGNALLALRRSDEALEAYQRALELDPAYAQGWYNLGVARATRREFALAEAAYRRALDLAPDELGARLNLGVVLAQEGRRLEARVELERVAREG